MRAHTLFAAAATLALVACSQTGGETQPPSSAPTTPPPVTASPGQTCDTSLIDNIGAPISSVRVPNNANYRVIRPNDVLTLDARETRTNIDLNADDTIAAVYCG